MDSECRDLYNGVMSDSSKPRPAPRLREPERTQVRFVLGSLDQMVADDHPVRAVWTYACEVDLSRLYETIRSVEGAPGHPATDPRILLALWIYATLDGVGSARRLAALCEEHQAYQWIRGGVSVNHHSLSDFRVDHVDLLEDLLVDGVAALMKAGLVTMKRVAQDGMRVRANAGAASFRGEATIQEHIEEARRQVDALRKELEENPVAMSKREKAARERAARERLERVKSAAEEVARVREHKQGKAEKEKARASETDPDARVTKMADGGFRPALNVQFATDTESGIVVGVDVVNAGNDKRQMIPMLKQLSKDYNTTPDEFLADGDYATLTEIERAETEYNCTVYIPVKAPHDKSRNPHEPLPDDTPKVSAWRQRMGTDEAKSIYKKRAQSAEWVNAQARNRGLLRLLVRGLRKARAVALWFALAHNLAQGLTLKRLGEPVAA